MRALSVTPASLMISVKPPLVKSCSVDTALGWRSRLLGVKTISGFRTPRRSLPPYIWGGSRGKNLGGGGAVAHLHVVFRAEREVALNARAGVFGALPFVAVGEEHHQAAGLAPLLLAAGDELVDHDLRAVGEIAELRFPDDQRQRLGHRVAELEAQHGVLAERAIERVEAPLVGRDVLRGQVALAGFGIVERQMALAEGAAAGILAAEAHRGAFERQRAEGQRFAESPIEIAALGDDFAALFDEAAQFGMQVKVFGELGDAADHALSHLVVDGGPRAVAADLFAGDRAELLDVVVLGALLRGVVGGGEARGALLADPSALWVGGHAFAHQALLVEHRDGGMLLDLAVQDGLRVAGVVAFVVAVAAVADHVDDHILLELLAVVEGDLHHADSGIWIVAVDVEDGRLHAARDVGGIGRGARFVGQGGEADLVVDDQVDGAAGGVAIELREVERLGHHALSGEGRIAVDQDGDDAFARRIAEAILLGTDDAFDYRVDGFQVARVGRDGNHDLAAAGGLAHARGAEVILDVARALRAARVDLAFEFAEDLFNVLADRVGEDVEAPAVGHADHQFVDVAKGGALQDFFQDGERGFAAFERESLLADEAGVQKMFELLARHHGAHDAHAGVAVERPVVGLGLHALLQPALLLRHLDIHVLAADFAAIGLAQGLQDFAQGGDGLRRALVARKAPRFGEAAGEKFAVQIPDGEAVGFGVEFGVVAGFGAQRVEIGDQVAAHAVGVDHLHDPGFLGDLGVARGVHAGQGGFAVGLPAHRLVRHAKVGEYLFVEPVLAIEQGLHAAQEHAGFGALYDAVIVGAGERHHFADAQHGARLAGGAEVFGGVTDSAGGDDGALADHEARAGGHGADGAGVGERNGGALEIGGGEFGAAGAGHQVVESGDVFLETERASVLDVGHHEAARAVLARDVDGDAEVHLGPHQTEGLAVALGVGVVESGDFFQGFDDGPADEVGIGNFAAADEGAGLIDDAPVLVHHLPGDGALRGGERNGDAGRHVFGDPSGGAAQRQQLLAGCGFGDGDLEGCCRGAVGQWAGLFEYVLPAFIDGGTVVQVLLIQLVFEPAIDAHFRFGLRGHWGGETFAFHDTKRPRSVAFQAAMPVSVPAFFPGPRNGSLEKLLRFRPL